MSGFEGDLGTSPIMQKTPDLTRRSSSSSISQSPMDLLSGSNFSMDSKISGIGRHISGMQKAAYDYKQASLSEIDLNMQKMDLLRSSVSSTMPSYASDLMYTGTGSTGMQSTLIKPIDIQPVQGSLDMGSSYMKKNEDSVVQEPIANKMAASVQQKQLKKDTSHLDKQEVRVETEVVTKYIEVKKQESEKSSDAQPAMQVQSISGGNKYEEEEEDEEVRPRGLEAGEAIVILRPTEALTDKEKNSWIRPKSQKEKLYSKLQRLSDDELFKMAEKAFNDASCASSSEQLMVANAKKVLLSKEAERRSEIQNID